MSIREHIFRQAACSARRGSHPINKPKLTKNRQSFTLIELLIVIAIIALLTAMLLPGLQRAKGTARRIACVTNIKQIGTGIFSYVDDNGGYLPSVDLQIAGGPPRFWFTFVDAYLKGKTATKNDFPSSRVWACPANPYKDQLWGYTNLPYGYNQYLGYYRADNYVITNIVKLTQVRRPSSIIMVGDSDGDAYYDAFLAPNYYFLGILHDGTGNLSFVDNHVEQKRRNQVSGSSWPPELLYMWGAYGYYAK